MGCKALNTKARRRERDRLRKRAEISPERVLQFERLLGRKWRGSPDSAHGTALGVLCDRDYITDDMKDRGHTFQKLFAVFYPGVKGNHIAELSGRGSIGMLPEDREEAIAILEGHFKRSCVAIHSVRGAYDIVYSVAVSGLEPDWLVRRIALEDEKRQHVELWVAKFILQIGQDDKEGPKRIKEIKKRAERIRSNIRDHVKFKMTWRETQELDRLKAGLRALIDGGK